MTEVILNQKEAVDLTIDLVKKLMASTRNPTAQASLEQAMYSLSSVKAQVMGNGIPEYDEIFIKMNGSNIKIQL